jgi:MarR family transcriptional regulator, 2-MHQ and catechol-resistance regulon repressor
MASRLQNELKKRGPFDSLEQEALLNLVRTNDQFQICFTRLFRQYDLTPAQYNVLRILRGAGEPLPILEVAERMITVVPGITGLIDRLEQAGWVKRLRSQEDRRVIRVDLTSKAGTLLAKLDEPVLHLHRDLLGHLTQDELRQLSRLLEKARQSLDSAER